MADPKENKKESSYRVISDTTPGSGDNRGISSRQARDNISRGLPPTTDTRGWLQQPLRSAAYKPDERAAYINDVAVRAFELESNRRRQYLEDVAAREKEIEEQAKGRQLQGPLTKEEYDYGSPAGGGSPSRTITSPPPSGKQGLDVSIAANRVMPQWATPVDPESERGRAIRDQAKPYFDPETFEVVPGDELPRYLAQDEIDLAHSRARPGSQLPSTRYRRGDTREDK